MINSLKILKLFLTTQLSLQKNTKWKWLKECQCNFDLAKQKHSSSKVLTHYNPSLPILIGSNASAYGLGAVIAHVFPDGSRHPVAITSCTLTSSEKNYAQVKEALFSYIAN